MALRDDPRPLPAEESYSLRNMYLSGLVVLLVYISIGMNLVWTSPSMLALQSAQILEYNQKAAIVSSYPFGAVLGPTIGILLSDSYGFKALFYLYTGMSFLSEFLLYFSTSVFSICLGRILSGIAVGALFLQLPRYASEIVEEEIVTMLEAVKLPAQVLGYALVYALGPQLTYNQLLSLYLPIPLVTLCCQLWMPESPAYHILTGQREQAKQTVYFLHRGISTNGAEKIVQKIQDSTNDRQSQNRDWWTLLSVEINKKSSVYALVYVILQQLAGSSLIFMIMQTLLAKVTSGSISFASVLVGLVLLVGSVIIPYTTSSYHQKHIILVSTGCMAVTMVVFGLSFSRIEPNSSDTSIIAVGCILLYLVASNSETACSEKMLTSLHNKNFQAIGTLLTTTVSTFVTFLVSFAFYSLSNILDTHLSLWIFAIFSLSLAAYAHFCLPQQVES